MYYAKQFSNQTIFFLPQHMPNLLLLTMPTAQTLKTFTSILLTFPHQTCPLSCCPYMLPGVWSHPEEGPWYCRKVGCVFYWWPARCKCMEVKSLVPVFL